uniref:Uncharacterized protein n=1 Tax=Oryza brachyantha TaxID=4533 RepID=J3LEL6_ORYBR
MVQKRPLKSTRIALVNNLEVQESGWMFQHKEQEYPPIMRKSHFWSNQVAPVSSSPITATVTDPITLHLHTMSQSYIVMVTYPYKIGNHPSTQCSGIKRSFLRFH